MKSFAHYPARRNDDPQPRILKLANGRVLNLDAPVLKSGQVMLKSGKIVDFGERKRVSKSALAKKQWACAESRRRLLDGMERRRCSKNGSGVDPA